MNIQWECMITEDCDFTWRLGQALCCSKRVYAMPQLRLIGSWHLSARALLPCGLLGLRRIDWGIGAQELQEACLPQGSLFLGLPGPLQVPCRLPPRQLCTACKTCENL